MNSLQPSNNALTAESHPLHQRFERVIQTGIVSLTMLASSFDRTIVEASNYTADTLLFAGVIVCARTVADTVSLRLDLRTSSLDA